MYKNLEDKKWKLYLEVFKGGKFNESIKENYYFVIDYINFSWL